MIYICNSVGSSTECISEASSSPLFINGFSYDGIIMGFFMFLVFCLMFYRFIYESYIGLKQKTKHYE